MLNVAKHVLWDIGASEECRMQQRALQALTALLRDCRLQQRALQALTAPVRDCRNQQDFAMRADTVMQAPQRLKARAPASQAPSPQEERRL